MCLHHILIESEKRCMHMEEHNSIDNDDRFVQGNMSHVGGHYYYDNNHNPISAQMNQQQGKTSNQSYMQANQQPVSPYHMYAKPPQPEGWAGQMNEEYFQEPTKKPNPIMQHFYDENGQMDIQKMLTTVNQLANTVQQVSPVFQQISSLVRLIR